PPRSPGTASSRSASRSSSAAASTAAMPPPASTRPMTRRAPPITAGSQPAGPTRSERLAPALRSELLDLLEDGVAHLAGRDPPHARLHDVAGADAGIEDAFHRAVDHARLLGEIEGIAQHHREG